MRQELLWVSTVSEGAAQAVQIELDLVSYLHSWQRELERQHFAPEERSMCHYQQFQN